MLAVGACALLLSGSFAPAAMAARHGAGPGPVAVTLTNIGIAVRPMTIAPGHVVFRIANRSTTARDFSFAGKRTPRIAPGKTALLRVTVTKTGTLLYLSYSARRGVPFSGALNVVAACTQPRTTTIDIQMQEAPITLSQQTVPCGTVTFAITNAGTMIHTFQIGAPNDPATVLGHGPRLAPGQSASVTVRFTTKGTVQYACSEPEHGEMYGEIGSLTVD